MIFSAPSVMILAVCGVRCTSFSMPARALATVSSSSKPPSCIINATSPAAKISPMQTDAISARETSTSALMSNCVTNPTTASRIIGSPQKTIAIQAASKGIGRKGKMLNSRAMPETASRTTSFLIPPRFSSHSIFFIKCFISRPLSMLTIFTGRLYIYGYRLSRKKNKIQPCPAVFCKLCGFTACWQNALLLW